MSPTNEAQRGNLAPVEDKNAYDGSITWEYASDVIGYGIGRRFATISLPLRVILWRHRRRLAIINPVAFKHLVFSQMSDIMASTSRP